MVFPGGISLVCYNISVRYTLPTHANAINIYVSHFLPYKVVLGLLERQQCGPFTV
jgi:hypothetical protein